jgi:hypothetical protein
MESTITTTELKNVLLNMNGTPFISFVTDTEVRMNKTNNPFFGRVRKEKFTVVQSGFDYEKSVNNRLKKEGKENDFKSVPNWMKLVDENNLFLVTDKKTETKFYFRYQYVSDKPIKTNYTLDGKKVNKDLLFSFIGKYLPKSKSYSNQNLDNPLRFSTVKLENIKEITINKTKYVIV